MVRKGVRADAFLDAIGDKGGEATAEDSGNPDRANAVAAAKKKRIEEEREYKLKKARLNLEDKMLKTFKKEEEYREKMVRGIHHAHNVTIGKQALAAARGPAAGVQAGGGGGGGGVATTAGGFLLAQAITTAANQSKILTTVMDTVGKILGLALDLFLLPFIPIILPVLKDLVNGLTAAGKIWKEFVGDLTTPQGVLKFLLNLTPVGPLADSVGNLLKILNSANLSKSIDVTLSFITGTIVGALAGIAGAAWNLINWAFGSGQQARVGVDIAINFLEGALSGALAAIGNAIWGLINFIFGTSQQKQIVDIELNLLKGGSDAVWDVAEGIYSGISNGVGALEKDVSNFMGGGGQTNNITINGSSFQTQKDLIDQVNSFLRTAQYMYNAVTT